MKIIGTMKMRFTLALTLALSAACAAQPDSLGLQDLVNCALERNADLLTQSAQSRIAGIKWRQAWTQMLPQVDAEGSYIRTSGHDDMPDFVAANGLREKVAWLSATQTLFNPETFLNISEGRFDRDREKILTDQTRQEVLLQVVEGYFAVLKARGEVQVFTDNLAGYRLIYDQSRILFQNGAVPELDVKKSQVKYLLQQNSLANARKDHLSTLNHLKELIGMPATDSLAIRDFGGYAIRLDSLSVYLNQALTNRPELKALQVESRRALSQSRTALLGYLPTAGIGAYYGWDTNDPPRRDNLGWQFYLNLRLPLWHWGRQFQDYQVAGLRYRANEFQRQKTQSQITQEVINAYNEARVQMQQLQAMQESKIQAAEAVRMSKLGYQEGSVTYLEVINAQNLLIQTNVGYLRSLYDFWAAKARLYRSMGRLEENLQWLE